MIKPQLISQSAIGRDDDDCVFRCQSRFAVFLNYWSRVVGLIGRLLLTLSAWILMRYSGRRPIIFWGLVWTIVPNLIIGGLGTMGKGHTGALYTIGAFMIFIKFNYHLTIGPFTYTIASEIPASTLRIRSIALGRFVYVVDGIIVGTLNPYMVSETAWNWGAKSGFLWAGTGCLCLVWTYFRLPETAALSFAVSSPVCTLRIWGQDQCVGRGWSEYMWGRSAPKVDE